MKNVNPRHRIEALRNKERAPEDTAERTLYVLLHGAAALNKVTPLRPWDDSQVLEPTIEYPFSVYKTPVLRTILEAFLIASPDEQAISNALAMPVDEVSQYRYLFFDTSVFTTDLELIAFIQSIDDQDPHKEMYKIAFHQGLDALQWHFCRDKGNIAPDEVIRVQMIDAHFRALQHRGKVISGKIAREARAYANMAIVAARTAKLEGNEDNPERDEDLRFKFEQARKNRTIKDLEKDEIEVLH